MEPGQPIGPPRARMAVDGRKLFASLVKVAVGGLTAWVESLGGALHEGSGIGAVASGFADSLTAFNSKETNEGKAWLLLSLSLASALHAVRPRMLSGRNRRDVEAAFSRLEAETLAVLEQRPGTFALTREFFESPTHLPLYQRLRPALVEGARSYLPDNARADETCVRQLGARLDSAFSAAVYEIMLTSEAMFASLQAAVFAPGHEAARREYDWKRYRYKLIEQFELAPIPGEETDRVTLAHLYVPLRATWREVATDGVTHRACGLLHREILQWVHARSGSAIRLIVGGPGAGKTTFAKALACEFAKDPSVRPLYLPLHRLDDIRDVPLDHAYVDYLKTWGKFSSDPLSAAATNPSVPFVEIFDGLDELVRPGSRGVTEVANRFVSWLDRHLRKATANTVAIVTGRPVMMAAFLRELPDFKPHHVLHVEGLAPLQSTSARSFDRDYHSVSRRDYRADWWRNYAYAVGADLAIPRAFTEPATAELTNEPLLAYLIAVLGAQDADWKSVTSNKAALYQTLMRKIWERSWGESSGPLSGRRTGPGQRLTLDDFSELMDCVAYAAWLDGNIRVATLEDFDKARDALGIKRSAWDRFKEDMLGDLRALALTFYLRGAETEDQGFEFTHKTFGEFLLARFLLYRFVKIIGNATATHAGILFDWLTITGGSLVDKSVARFMRELAQLVSGEQRRHTIEIGVRLLTDIITDGLPVHRLGDAAGERYRAYQLRPGSGRDLERIQRRSQVNFLCCLNALVTAERGGREFRAWPLAINWPDQGAPARFLSRLIETQDVESTEILGLSGLGYSSVDENGKVLFAPLLSGIYLAGAPLVGSCFAGAQLDRANFSYSDLTGADLTQAVAIAADFSGATCISTSFSRAELGRADFIEANLEDANLDGALLTAADLRRANLKNADLRHADLRRADLRSAELAGARLSGAFIAEARLPENWESLVNLEDGPPNLDPCE